jgi:hypothetical protein
MSVQAASALLLALVLDIASSLADTRTNAPFVILSAGKNLVPLIGITLFLGESAA